MPRWRWVIASADSCVVAAVDELARSDERAGSATSNAGTGCTDPGSKANRAAKSEAILAYNLNTIAIRAR
jgi:hypothetical protein